MSGAIRERVERHAAALDDIGKAMSADGIGLDSLKGHVVTLRRMAASMRSDAAVGKTPHRYDDGAMKYASGTGPRLSAQSLATLRAAGLDGLMAGDDRIALADLNQSLTESGTPPDQRVEIKQILASAGRLTH